MSVFALFFTEEHSSSIFMKMRNSDFVSGLLDLNHSLKLRIRTGTCPHHQSIIPWNLPELRNSKALKQAFYAWLSGDTVAYLEGSRVSLETIIPAQECQIIVAKAQAAYSRETGSATASANNTVSIRVPGQTSMLVTTSLTQQVNWEGLRFAGDRNTKMPANFDDFLVLCYCAAFGCELPRRVENVWSNGPMEGEFATVRKSVWQCYLQSPRRSA